MPPHRPDDRSKHHYADVPWFIDSEGNMITPLRANMELVKLQHTEYLWYPFLPMGELVLLSGDPDQGKSQIAAYIAASVSSGEPFPKILSGGREITRDAGRVFIINSEDSVAKTLAPRLVAAGAIMGNIEVEEGLYSGTPDVHDRFSLQNVGVLAKHIEDLAPTLIIIDCLDSYMGRGVDNNQSSNVRGVLDPLKDIANDYNTTILMVRHFSKGKKDNAAHRGSGSVAFTGAARSELHVGLDPEDDEDDLNQRRRILVQAKGNLSRKAPSLAYRIIGAEVREDGEVYETSRIVWDGLSRVTADDLNNPPERDREERSAKEEARDFLYAQLADGPVPSKDVVKEAKACGISERTLKRARFDLGVTATRIGDQWVLQLGKSTPS